MNKATKARKEGLRARSAYKLKELNKKYDFMKKGDIIIDLGAYPGGWSVVASTYGKVWAVDLKKIKPIKNTTIIQGDFFQEEIKKQLPKANLVLSDAAPNTTGVKFHDSKKSTEIAKEALKIAKEKLKKNGNFVCKIFQGESFEKLLKEIKKEFEFTKATKPPTSRKKSKEMYIIAKRYKTKKE